MCIIFPLKSKTKSHKISLRSSKCIYGDVWINFPKSVANKRALIFTFWTKTGMSELIIVPTKAFPPFSVVYITFSSFSILFYLSSFIWIKTYFLEYSFFLQNFVKFLVWCYFTEIEKEQKNNFIDSFCFNDTCVQRSIYWKML